MHYGRKKNGRARDLCHPHKYASGPHICMNDVRKAFFGLIIGVERYKLDIENITNARRPTLWEQNTLARGSTHHLLSSWWCGSCASSVRIQSTTTTTGDPNRRMKRHRPASTQHHHHHRRHPAQHHHIRIHATDIIVSARSGKEEYEIVRYILINIGIERREGSHPKKKVCLTNSLCNPYSKWLIHNDKTNGRWENKNLFFY